MNLYELHAKNQGLIFDVIKKIPPALIFDRENLEQELQLCLWNLCAKFEPERNLKFSTFAYFILRRTAYITIHQTSTIIRPSISNDWEKWHWLVGHTKSIDALKYNKCKESHPTLSEEDLLLYDSIVNFISKMTGRNGEIFKMYYLENLSCEDIAQRFKVSKQRVYQIVKKIMDTEIHEFMMMRYNWCFCFNCKRKSNVCDSPESKTSSRRSQTTCV